MHLIVSYAFGADAACRQALQKLELPHLRALLNRLTALPPSSGDGHSLNTPDEHALAATLALPCADGQIPWAALQAQQKQLGDDSGCWAFISLCHWQLLADQIVMRHCPITDLSSAHEQALLLAMRPYLEEDGIKLYSDQPGRWLAQAPCFEQLFCASPERALGRDLRAWMPTGTSAPALKRLQNEMQMLLHTHPVNEERHAHGQVIVNSFWLHGNGSLPAGYAPPTTKAQSEHRLRASLLAQDWPAWAQAWQAIDASSIKALSDALDQQQAVELTLCGERRAQTWRSQRQSPWQALRSRLFSKPLVHALEDL